MKTSCLTLAVIAGLVLPSCKKSTVNGSPYTHLLCGSHNFRVIGSGYDPVVGQNFTDTSDVVNTITCNNSGSVTFGGSTFTYDSTTGSVVQYYYNASPLEYGYINFDYNTEAIYIFISKHISAAAGDWVYIYTSY